MYVCMYVCIKYFENKKINKIVFFLSHSITQFTTTSPASRLASKKFWALEKVYKINI